MAMAAAVPGPRTPQGRCLRQRFEYAKSKLDAEHVGLLDSTAFTKGKDFVLSLFMQTANVHQTVDACAKLTKACCIFIDTQQRSLCALFP